jgi:hypothetical protein
MYSKVDSYKDERYFHEMFVVLPNIINMHGLHLHSAATVRKLQEKRQL